MTPRAVDLFGDPVTEPVASHISSEFSRCYGWANHCACPECERTARDIDTDKAERIMGVGLYADYGFDCELGDDDE